MNYALDALWWRLCTPEVRDLAMLLTAPPPWRPPALLPVRALLGEQGFRYLLALDAAPQALLAHLAARRAREHRLGRYAEDLLAFWLAQAPHCRLWGEQVALCDEHGRTLGAADFIADINGVCCHIELACKYFAAADGGHWRGLWPQDTLAAKEAKLVQQLALGRRADFQAACALRGLPMPQQHRALVRGMLFQPPGNPAPTAPAYAGAWQGWCAHDGDRLRSAVTEADGAAVRFARLPRGRWLAPARLGADEVTTAAGTDWQTAGMLSVLQLRGDGAWHEIRRLLILAA